MRKAILAMVLALATITAQAVTIDEITNSDAVAGLKEALEKGAGKAVANLGKVDGFLANERVKIPLPESLRKAERTLRKYGMDQLADDMIMKMNRAAEEAVPEAKVLLVDAVKGMSVEDAKGILTGGETSATEYFRRTTSAPLAEKFRPIVKEATSKVGLRRSYNNFAGKASRWGLIGKEQASIDDYVTQKALDGLFVMIADEEKAIRANPLEQGSKVITKVFGSLLD
ncbi:MAG TPA: DUF4197 domain-containing protein [Gammaproteobacteria bacterium]